jgi:hypothetical protein
LALLSGEQQVAVEERARAFANQIRTFWATWPDDGFVKPLPPVVALPEAPPPTLGSCVSCGVAVNSLPNTMHGSVYRCLLCLRALDRALDRILEVPDWGG